MSSTFNICISDNKSTDNMLEEINKYFGGNHLKVYHSVIRKSLLTCSNI